jgi:hypothetical protein
MAHWAIQARCPCRRLPHIGADAYGFYITTNSYPWVRRLRRCPDLRSRRRSCRRCSDVTMVHIDTTGGEREVTVARSAGLQVARAVAGNGLVSLERAAPSFLSSNAAEEAARAPIPARRPTSSWTLTNTRHWIQPPRAPPEHKVLTVDQYGPADAAAARFRGAADVAIPQVLHQRHDNGDDRRCRLLATALRSRAPHNESFAAGSNDTRCSR